MVLKKQVWDEPTLGLAKIEVDTPPPPHTAAVRTGGIGKIVQKREMLPRRTLFGT